MNPKLLNIFYKDKSSFQQILQRVDIDNKTLPMRLTILIGLLIMTSTAFGKESSIHFKYVNTSADPLFESSVADAVEKVLEFSRKNNLRINQVSDFLENVVLYADKVSFDEMLYQAGVPKDKKIPETYLGLAQNRTFHVVSWLVYKSVHPQDSMEDYLKLITHESVHLFHVAYLNGEEDQMGPRWFYEGLACWLAGQYLDETPSLSNELLQKALLDPEFGDYKIYVAIFKRLIAKKAISELLESAKEESFSNEMLKLLRQ